jgi:two-component system, LuxR family, response regulator FixJ
MTQLLTFADPALLLDSVREAWQRTAASQERRARVADIEARQATLTPRETEILQLLVEAYLNTAIAAKLGTSTRNFDSHGDSAGCPGH